MTNMPQRPAQHDIKTAAERAFLAAAPDTWEIQKREEDYGIDFDVEVFSGGAATGIRFGVQMKGTRQKTGSPHTRIKVSTWEYWRAHDTPTLVVLWNDHHRHLWASWAHRFDTYGLDLERTEFPYAFTDKDKWTPDTPGALERELAAVRANRAPQAHLPVPVDIEPAGTLEGVRLGSLLAGLRRRIGAVPDLLTLAAPGDAALVFSVDLTTDVSVVKLAGGTSFNLHHGAHLKPDNEEDAAGLPESLSADLMIGFGLHFARLGLATEAARIVAASINDSSLIWKVPMGGELLTLLLEQSYFEEVTWLMEQAVQLVDTDPLDAMVIGILAAGPTVTADKRIAVTELMERLGDGMAAAYRSAEGARLVYNASLVVSHTDLNRRIELLEHAADLDGSYRKRRYWLQEMGGSLFLLGRHEEAIGFYEQVVAGGEEEAVSLLGDALLSSGRYAEALERFDTVGARGVPRDSEWRLKLRIVRFLIDKTGIERQDRDPAHAAAVLEEGPHHARDSLDLDLLEPDALWTLGRTAEDAGDADARDWFLSMVVGDLYSAHSWVRVLVCDWSDDEATHTDIGCTARYLCGDMIIEVLLELVDDPGAIRDVHRFFDGLPVDEDPGEDRRMLGLRTFAPDGTYAVDHSIRVR